MTRIAYFIPEDGDIEDQPNVFEIPKSSDNCKVKDIREFFPLTGDYIFRFKKSFKSSYYWLDFNNDREPVPLFNSKIILKVSRIASPVPSPNSIAYSQPIPEKQKTPTPKIDPEPPKVQKQKETPKADIPVQQPKKSPRPEEPKLEKDLDLFSAPPMKSSSTESDSKPKIRGRMDTSELLDVDFQSTANVFQPKPVVTPPKLYKASSTGGLGSLDNLF